MCSLGKVIAMLGGVTHWAACCWHAIGTIPSEENTWITEKLWDQPANLTTYQRYLMSVYFTLTTMTTVGYGDISPVNYTEVLYGIVLLLVASVVFAGLMGVLTDVISHFNNKAHEQKEKRKMLRRYMSWRGVPQKLSMSIRAYLTFMWETIEGYDLYEDELKGQLPPVLRSELCSHIYGSVLRSAPFLYWMRHYEVCVKHLASMVDSTFRHRGDFIFRMGVVNEEMFLLISGSVFLSRTENLFGQDQYQATKKDRYTTHDHYAENLADGFRIPRKREAHLYETGMELLHMHEKAERIRELRENSIVASIGNFKKQVREAHSDKGDAFNLMFDSETMRFASAQLQDLDVRRYRAATFVQRIWRGHKVRMKLHKQKTHLGNTKKGFAGMQSKTVDAPAYFGESCLWVPMSQWGQENAPLCMYSARCETQVEVVSIAQRSIAELLDRFSPWLGDRFEYFRDGVVAAMKPYYTDCDGRRRSAKDLSGKSTMVLPGDDYGFGTPLVIPQLQKGGDSFQGSRPLDFHMDEIASIAVNQMHQHHVEARAKAAADQPLRPNDISMQCNGSKDNDPV
eukprot:gnl/TRDRNA2_/TRDRNA2_147119_c0_seq2.p1 gnl/TRDRNA2_/TRDRNA2_147119_c0~~gnl/TRDRNA2_/TRDRNA2_147119_c0_seq2.p1  ORF type:complete len:568 (-),score=68.50 gnl/TRDRNA2_/TRDRNA2_147119_c0_seq2:61-1764(-)